MIKRWLYNTFLHLPMALGAFVGAFVGLGRDIMKSAVIGFRIGYGNDTHE